MLLQPRHAGGFWRGLCFGFTCGSGFLLLPLLWLGSAWTTDSWAIFLSLVSRLQELASSNLQGAAVPFALVLAVYCVQLLTLSRELENDMPSVDRVLRHEQLLDLCANLFFGIGVIWTAIGMRDALLHSLGDAAFAARAGAFAVLQRLVEGGILLALSTTIVGGIGGYLMRVIKSVSLGQHITAVYLAASEQPQQDNIAALRRIEQALMGESPHTDETFPTEHP